MSFNPTPRQIEAFVIKHFEYKERKSGTEMVICNPFDGDAYFHFGISKTKGVCHDWHGDEWAGPPSLRTNKRNTSFVHFVQKFLNCSYQEAVRVICETASDPMPSLRRQPSDASRRHRRGAGRPEASDGDDEPTEAPLVALPTAAEPIATSKQTMLVGALTAWLKSRGITQDDIRRYNLHHIAASVIWPYYEFEVLVYWQLRSRLNKQFLFPDEEKFGVSKGQFLYNFDEVEPARELVIVESIFNCFTIREQCVATGGADITSQQIQKIHLLGPRDGVILAPDNDVAGMNSVVKNGKMLQERGFKVYYSMPPELHYVENTEDGPVDKITKDWNELCEHVRMPLADIRKTMLNNIAEFNLCTKIRLTNLINKLQRDKKSIKIR